MAVCCQFNHRKLHAFLPGLTNTNFMYKHSVCSRASFIRSMKRFTIFCLADDSWGQGYWKTILQNHSIMLIGMAPFLWIRKKNELFYVDRAPIGLGSMEAYVRVVLKNIDFVVLKGQGGEKHVNFILTNALKIRTFGLENCINPPSIWHDVYHYPVTERWLFRAVRGVGNVESIVQVSRKVLLVGCFKVGVVYE